MGTKEDLKLLFSIAQNVILLFVGAVLTFSIGVVREISGDVNTIKVVVARGEQTASHFKEDQEKLTRRTERLEGKVFGAR